LVVNGFSVISTFLIHTLQRGEQKVVRGGMILVAADQVAGPRGSARGRGQVRAPGGMLVRSHKGTAQAARFTISPTLSRLRKKMLTEHNDDPIHERDRSEDFAHIMQERGSQQVWLGVAGMAQALQHVERVRLFEEVHPAEKNDLWGG
jgi:hypothetical protein